MQSLKNKMKHAIKAKLEAYLKAHNTIFPRASSFGIQEPDVLRRPRLNFRERSFQVISFSQQGEDLILNRILTSRLKLRPKKTVGFYMDVGAFHPISHSTSYGLYKFGWSGVCVDISKDTCALMRKFRPRDEVFHCAIGRGDVEKNAASVDHLSLLSKIDYNVDGKSENSLINSRSISSILDEIGKVDRVDYLNIDVEGAEIEALEGLDFHRHRPKVISIEIHARDIFSGLDTDVAKKLLGEGYVPVGCAAITYFFVHGGDLS